MLGSDFILTSHAALVPKGEEHDNSPTADPMGSKQGPIHIATISMFLDQHALVSWCCVPHLDIWTYRMVSSQILYQADVMLLVDTTKSVNRAIQCYFITCNVQRVSKFRRKSGTCQFFDVCHLG